MIKRVTIVILTVLMSISIANAQKDSTKHHKKHKQDTEVRTADDNSEIRVATEGSDEFVPIDDADLLIDTVGPVTKNPKLAGWLSFAVPGLGQIYNGQYWKVPLIYGIAGTLFYVSQTYNTRYKLMVNEEHYYLHSIGADTTWTGNRLTSLQNEADIVYYMRKYRRYRDLCYVAMFLTYFMNIFDAVVDAHLYDFNVSDDLSLKIEPYSSMPFAGTNMPDFGARLVLRF